MTSERICPVMSRPIDPMFARATVVLLGKIGNGTITELNDPKVYDESSIPCQRERCMAWVPEVSDSIVCKEGYSFGFDECKKAYNGFNNVVLMHDPDCNDCILARVKKGKDGYCKLIERGRQ